MVLNSYLNPQLPIHQLLLTLSNSYSRPFPKFADDPYSHQHVHGIKYYSDLRQLPYHNTRPPDLEMVHLQILQMLYTFGVMRSETDQEADNP